MTAEAATQISGYIGYRNLQWWSQKDLIFFFWLKQKYIRCKNVHIGGTNRSTEKKSQKSPSPGTTNPIRS